MRKTIKETFSINVRSMLEVTAVGLRTGRWRILVTEKEKLKKEFE